MRRSQNKRRIKKEKRKTKLRMEMEWGCVRGDGSAVTLDAAGVITEAAVVIRLKWGGRLVHPKAHGASQWHHGLDLDLASLRLVVRMATMAISGSSVNFAGSGSRALSPCDNTSRIQPHAWDGNSTAAENLARKTWKGNALAAEKKSQTKIGHFFSTTKVPIGTTWMRLTMWSKMNGGTNCVADLQYEVQGPNSGMWKQKSLMKMRNTKKEKRQTKGKSEAHHQTALWSHSQRVTTKNHQVPMEVSVGVSVAAKWATCWSPLVRHWPWRLLAGENTMRAIGNEICCDDPSTVAEMILMWHGLTCIIGYNG